MLKQSCNTALEIQVSPQECDKTMASLQNLFSLRGSLRKLTIQKEGDLQVITAEFQNQEEAQKAFQTLNSKENTGLGKISLTF